jgi:hypothetical protein
MEDIYYMILAKLNLSDLVKLESVSSLFYNIIQELVVVKIKMKGFINYLKNNTIFPTIVKLKKINVFTKSYRNREEEPIIVFN